MVITMNDSQLSSIVEVKRFPASGDQTNKTIPGNRASEAERI